MKNTTSLTAGTVSRLNEAADVWRVMLKDVYDLKQNVHAPGLKELFDNSSLICMYDNHPPRPGQCAGQLSLPPLFNIKTTIPNPPPYT